MARITIRFRDSDARTVLGFLRHRYKSKAGLEALAKKAIYEAVVAQASTELDEARKQYQQEVAEREKP